MSDRPAEPALEAPGGILTPKKAPQPAATTGDPISMVLVPDRVFPCAHVNLFFVAGPPFDPPGRAGLTTLTNRALIRGTRRRGRVELEEAVEILGAEMITATRNHAVSLGGPVLTRHLAAYLDLLGEALVQPALSADEVEKVKREMRAELDAAADEDGALARIWFARTLYGDHPYGHPATGSAASLARITADDVAAHARRVYCRRNLVVGASGDLTEAGLRLDLDRALAGMPDGARIEWDFAPPPRAKGRKVVLLDRADRGQAPIFSGHPTLGAMHPDALALHLGITGFGGNFTSRLMQKVRVERGWSYGASARLSLERSAGTFMMTAAPGREHAVDTLALLFDEFDRFAAEGLGDDETDFARESLALGFPFSVETASLQVAHRVRAKLLGRPDDYIDTWLDRLAAVDNARARAAVQAHLDPQALVTVMICSVDAALEKAVRNLPGVTDVEVRPAKLP